MNIRYKLRGKSIKKLIPLLFIASTSPTFCAQISWHFSPDFLTQYKPPQVIAPATHITPADALPVQLAQDASILSYENAQRTINIATILFAAIKIYERYQTIGTTTEPNMNDYQLIAAVKGIITSLCPDMLQSIGAYSFFLVDSTAIVFKALVYKTIAKLLLLCAQGDLSDLIGSIAQSGVHAAKLLF